MDSHWKLKDTTILELDLANVLTRKVVHKDLRNALVKFENFWSTTFRVIPDLVHCPESVFNCIQDPSNSTFF